MISYKYKLYLNRRTRHLDAMLREACFVWNHALALQRRYYRMYGRYVNCKRMKAHFAHRIHRELLHSQTVQEILERLDTCAGDTGASRHRLSAFFHSPGKASAEVSPCQGILFHCLQAGRTFPERECPDREQHQE